MHIYTYYILIHGGGGAGMRYGRFLDETGRRYFSPNYACKRDDPCLRLYDTRNS